MEVTAQIILCALMADFISGAGHWLEDTYGLPTWPVVGRLIVEPNIEHHRAPANMDQSFWGRNWVQVASCFSIAEFLAVCGWLTWQVALILGVVALANEVHAWSHGIGANPLSRFLQDMAIVQTPQHHFKHHHPPFDHRFCVMTNWVNPLLDRVRFWAWMESVVWLCFEVLPKRMTPERDYL